jgi:SNF2 family DNA or RNA helicase
MKTLPLFDHQRQSLEFIRERSRVFDASDPGTGKTRVAIESFSERRLRGGGAALIIAPKSLLKAAWQTDIRKFAPHLKTSVAYSENRDAAFAAEADCYITNHDAVKWLLKQKAPFFKNFDTLIIDEIGAFKHSTSQRSKALNKIKKYFSHRLGMNGTPTPNSVTELWNQLFVIDDGARLGPSFFGFRAAVCKPQQTGPSASMLKWIDKEGASNAVTKLIEDITIRHKFEDCIDIPENHKYAVPYELSSTQRSAYDQMEKDQISLLFGSIESAVRSKFTKEAPTKVVSAVNAAVAATKLLQIASGAVYEDSDTYHLIDTGRYNLVLDIAEERKHSVIFFLWKHQKDYLIAEAEKRGLTYCVIDGSVNITKRNEDVDYFQKGLYRLCFVHPQSGAHGLTLTRGTTTIWPSPTYNLEHYQQGLKRIYRAGQTQKTETITIVATGTIEDRVWAALQNKSVRMEDLLSQLENTK